jgi:NADH:ubiquinone oxidoreductase subunit E
MSRPVRLIVCINERLGTGQRSCVESGSLDYIRDLRARISEEKLDVSVVERECLGKCEEGPVMRIAPGGRFFTDINEASLPLIMTELKAFILQHET